MRGAGCELAWTSIDNRGIRSHIQQVLALVGEAVKSRQRAHDLLDQHVSPFSQLIECARGVGISCSEANAAVRVWHTTGKGTGAASLQYSKMQCDPHYQT